MPRGPATYVVTSLLLALPACSNGMLAQSSAPEVGCEANEIVVTDPHGAGMFSSGNATWVAECKGQRWFCTTLNKDVVCSDLPAGLELSD